MARAPVSKTGGWGFESLHSCHFSHQYRYLGLARVSDYWPLTIPDSWT
jgi:hypothetical protein